MSDLARMQREDATVRRWVAEVSTAALAFESRWTLLALRRVSPDIAHRLGEQRGMFDAVTITGTAEEIEDHGAAMCRGYAAAVRALQNSGEPDDAYVIGQDYRTGFRIAIGDQKAAADRVRELHGVTVVWFTPDELAALVANVEAFKAIGAVKRLFPSAEVIDVRPSDPAKGDSAVGAAA